MEVKIKDFKMSHKIDGVKLRVGILLIVLALIGYQYVRSRQPGLPPPHPRYIPPQGVPEEIDTHGKVPENPARELRDAKRLYSLIQIYRKRHNGEYPCSQNPDFISDLIEHAPDYGIGVGTTGLKRASITRDFISSFKNPDFKYADDPALRHLSPNTGMIPFFIFNKRPNGEPVGGPKQPGTQDVLAYNNLYVHQNVRYYKGDLTTSHPVGFYIVLWADGKVTEVPYNKILFYPQGFGNYKNAFPGQAGVPSDAITYDTYQKTVMHRSPKARVP